MSLVSKTIRRLCDLWAIGYRESAASNALRFSYLPGQRSREAPVLIEVLEPRVMLSAYTADTFVDYASVQANFGSVVESGVLGDANGDGVVPAGDYASVQANFDNTAPTTLDLLTKMIPEADAYIHANSPDTNFGSESNLKVQWGASADKWYKTYMRFDIGTEPQSFTGANLDFLLTYFANYLDSTHMLSVYGLRDGDAGENWDESTITWNNAPGNDPTTGNNLISAQVVFLGYMTHTDGYSLGAVTSFSNPALLSFLNADTNGKVTFIVTSDIYWNMNRWYASKENEIYDEPALELLIEDPALLEGDANRDGVVSAGDYASVQANFGNTGALGICILGDANCDGVVSAGDYASVQANFGNILTSPILDGMTLETDADIAPYESLTVNFELTQADYDLINEENKQLCLYLDSRIIWGCLGGHTVAMQVKMNGEGVKGRTLLNKPLTFTMRNGEESTWASLDGFSYRLFYSPDYSDRLMTDETYPYGLFEPDQDPFHFVWDVSSMVNVGTNELEINNGSGLDFSLNFRDVGLEIADPSLSLINEQIVLPPPTGPLSEYSPKAPQEIPASIEVSELGGIRFTVDGRTFEALTRTSLPSGNWCNENTASSWSTVSSGNSIVASWNGSDYTVQRTVTLHTDHISVSDTISNTGGNLVGVMVENKLKLTEEPQETLLSGITSDITIERTNGKYHPTAIAQYDDLVIGMAAEDDIFRMHCVASKESDGIVLADRKLGISPGTNHTLEWSIYMVPDGDYWDFINAVRRIWGCNYTLNGSLSFPPNDIFNYSNAQNLTAAMLQDWLNSTNNSISSVMTHVAVNPNIPMATATKENPAVKHGTAILDATAFLDNTRLLVEKMEEADPTVKVFAYMHKNLCTEVPYWDLYRDSVALDKYGNPAVSIYEPEPGLFVPTLGNSYGAALTEVYEYFVENLDANIYVDEINLSYGLSDEWDGCTVDIDPNSHAVLGQEDSWLLMQPWLSSMMGYLQTNGKTAIGNGYIATRTMLNWGIQCFFENGMGPKAALNAHLGTPLAWAGYLTGQAGYDHVRQSLDYGGIAFTRSGVWSDYTFPITPIELRTGVVIAEERILTNRSGAFGWGDGSHANVYVFDGQGNLVENPDVAEVWDGDQLLTEIRMASDHMAILVRIPEYFESEVEVNAVYEVKSENHVGLRRCPRQLKSNGKTVIANGASATRTMLNWGIQYFVEDGMGSKVIINSHLGTPLAWAGYMQGQPGYDHVRQSLDYAGIAFTRSGVWSNYTFPITPIELRAGDQLLTEIRMASDHMAILVRIP